MACANFPQYLCKTSCHSPPVRALRASNHCASRKTSARSGSACKGAHSSELQKHADKANRNTFLHHDPQLDRAGSGCMIRSHAIQQNLQRRSSQTRLSQPRETTQRVRRVHCHAYGVQGETITAVIPKHSQRNKPVRGGSSCSALPWTGPPAEATVIITITSILGLLATLPGLLMIHGGLARAGSVRSTFLSHFLTAALVATLWTTCAYSIAYSTQGMTAGTIDIYSFFGGFEKVMLSGVDAGGAVVKGANIPEMLFVLHSMQGAIAAACIMLGGLLERIKLVPRLAMVSLWTLLVYAPVCHAVSAGPGSLLGDLGVVDFAGSLAMHLAPAVSALTALRFCGGPGADEGVHNVLLTGIGFAFLWLGWLSHCAGAAAAGGAPVATVLLNAQLSSSVSALVWSSFDGAARCSSLVGVCFGAVSGLVAIMPACGHLNCFGALTTGFLAGFFAWLLKGPGGEPVKFPRVVAVASITGCLSAGLLSHPLFGGAQTSVVFSTQAVVQAFCALLVAAWASLGTMVSIGVVIVVFRKALLPEGGPGADVELVG